METAEIRERTDTVRIEETDQRCEVRVIDRFPDYGGGGTPYTGPLTVIPTDAEQTLLTAGKSMPGNVIVEEIPLEWGRIAWNGASLRVF